MKRTIWITACLLGAMVAGLREWGDLYKPWPQALVNRDFANLWAAGRLVLGGNLTTIFDPVAFTAATRELAGTTFRNSFSYPPHALFLAAPFGLLPFGPALLAWNAVSLAAFYLAARPLLPEALPRWVPILSPAALICLQFGHYGLICGALWILAFRGSGVSAAILTIKPHLGLLVAVRMLGDKRHFWTAAIATIVLVALSMAVFGLSSWAAFLTKNVSYHASLLGDTQRFGVNMVTPFISYGWTGQFIFAAAALVLLNRRFDVFTAATATFLIVPYGFHYDLTVATLGFAVLLAARWDDLSFAAKLVLLLGFVAPALVAFGSWLAPPILLACLYVQTRVPLALRAAAETKPVFGGLRQAAA